MKKIQLAYLGIIPAALLIAACGDDVTKVTKIEETSGLEMVASADSLGKCTAEISGEMKFATKENAVYVCADSVWKNVSAAEKAACSAETLSDSSGFKIVCDGDSIGVVKNGANGTDGEKGEAGKDGASGEGCKLVEGPVFEAGSSQIQTSFVVCGKDTVGTISDGRPGEGCDISDGGDGTVSVVCGDASTTLYKAFCGGKVYDPDSSFCLDGKVYKNKTLVWSLMNPEIEYDLFVDKRDDQVYRSVKIGEQTWMAENLNYAYNQETSSSDSSSFCYNNEPDSCAKYGRLYLWSAAMDSAAKFSDAGKDCGYGNICASADADSATTVRGVCPEGWHLPSSAEFVPLIYAAGGGKNVAGKVLKSVSGWKDYDGNSGSGTDSFGFSTLPAGYETNGDFFTDGLCAYFWFATEKNDANYAYYTFLPYNSEDAFWSYVKKNRSYSVRCVRD